MHACIGVDENTLCGEALRAVAGDSIAVVEMAVLTGIELNAPVVIEASSDQSA